MTTNTVALKDATALKEETVLLPLLRNRSGGFDRWGLEMGSGLLGTVGLRIVLCTLQDCGRGMAAILGVVEQVKKTFGVRRD